MAQAASDVQKPLNADVLLTLVNEYRVKINLKPFVKDPSLCDIVAKRATELYDEIYVNRNMHAGFHAMNLPFWASENIISARTEQEALTWWLNSPIHRSAIQSANTYSCGVCKGLECAQFFTNYEPRQVITFKK